MRSEGLSLDGQTRQHELPPATSPVLANTPQVDHSASRGIADDPCRHCVRGAVEQGNRRMRVGQYGDELGRRLSRVMLASE